MFREFDFVKAMPEDPAEGAVLIAERGLDPLAVPARRAGSAALLRAAGRGGARHRRQALRRDPGRWTRRATSRSSTATSSGFDRVHPIDPTLQAVLNQILEADLWQMKCVGMQVIVEGLAMGAFRIMKEGSRDAAAAQTVVEAHGSGRGAPRVLRADLHEGRAAADEGPEDRNRVEDFAFAAVDAISGRRAGHRVSLSQLSIIFERRRARRLRSSCRR